MKNGTKVHNASSIIDTADLDLWPGDTVQVRGVRYCYTADGKLVAK